MSLRAPTSRRPSPPSRADRSVIRTGAGLGAALGALLLAGVVSVAGASPSPAPGSPAAASPAATPGSTPSLTFAPLVTMPPIIVPDDAGLGDLADGYSLGAADAPVLVEVWEDFQCPYCARWTLQVEPLLIDTYVRNGQVRLTYRPLAFLGEESRWTAVAADLAAEQNRFWPFHHIVFSNHLGENVGAYGLDRLVEIGRLAGLDMDAYLDGLQLEKARARFAAIEEASQADAVRLGINATPTVVIDDRPLESPDWDSIRAAVEAALSARPAASPEG